MLACIGTEWKLLTWLRYSIWIPLYPLGVVAEGILSGFLIEEWFKVLGGQLRLTMCFSVGVSSGGRDPVAAHL